MVIFAEKLLTRLVLEKKVKIFFSRPESGTQPAPRPGNLNLFLNNIQIFGGTVMNSHKKIKFSHKNFFIPESTLQVIPVRLIAGSNREGVNA